MTASRLVWPGNIEFGFGHETTNKMTSRRNIKSSKSTKPDVKSRLNGGKKEKGVVTPN